MKAQEKVVSYFYDEEIGNFCYGGGNPMRPHRARMAYSLVDSYGLTKKMLVHRPRPRSTDELSEYHADDYIQFIKNVTPNSVDENMTQLRRFNMGLAGEADCPVFDGLFEYCQMYAGGSVDGAAMLNTGNADICLNWSGGMHHAKKAEASGFCYVNDIVMAILELLKVFQRVLYVDIDIHHGDGVEEAFYLTDRVMTVSFHKYGEFFPGTGAVDDIGYGKGKYYTCNVPLKDGMDDDSYKMLYEPIMQKVMEAYQPGAIVMCCGADSLSGDRLGCFNLSLEGHSNCLEFLKKFNVPMLVLGGGGYTLRNVARCWCYETGRMMGIDLPDNLPETALNDFNFYLDTQRLRIAVSNMKNANQKEELQAIKTMVLEHLSHMPAAPSVQMQYVPPQRTPAELPEEDPDVRGGGQAHEEYRRVREGEESDADDDGHMPDQDYRNGGDIPIEQPGRRTPDGDGGEAQPMDTDDQGVDAGAYAPATWKATPLVPVNVKYITKNGSPVKWEDPSSLAPGGSFREGAKSEPAMVSTSLPPMTGGIFSGGAQAPAAVKPDALPAASTPGIGVVGPSSGSGIATPPSGSQADGQFKGGSGGPAMVSGAGPQA